MPHGAYAGHDRRSSRRAARRAHPIRRFAQWLAEARDAGIGDHSAMSLATASEAGETTIRTVLLKGYSEDGFYFFTSGTSTKARQIARNPHVSLLFPWLLLERQVIVNGVAARMTLAEAAGIFRSEPGGGSSAVWLPLAARGRARAALEEALDALVTEGRACEGPARACVAYCVTPHAIEFWEGGGPRLCRRERYRRGSRGTWVKTRTEQ